MAHRGRARLGRRFRRRPMRRHKRRHRRQKKSKRANRTIAKVFRFQKRNHPILIQRPIGHPNHTVKIFSNSYQIVVIQTLTNGQGNLDYSLGNFMLASDLTWIKANYLVCRPISMCISARIIKHDYLGDYLAVPVTGANYPVAIANDSTSGQSLDFWYASFISGIAQSQGANINNTTTNARQLILSTPYYRRMLPKGTPLVNKWHNTKGHDGDFNSTNDLAAITTTIATCFANTASTINSAPINNCLHGNDYHWFNIASYYPQTTFTIELIGTMALELRDIVAQAA